MNHNGFHVSWILLCIVSYNANIKRPNQTPHALLDSSRRHEHLNITRKHPRVSICNAIYIRYIYIQMPVSKYVSLSAFTGGSTYSAVNITPLTIFNQHFLKRLTNGTMSSISYSFSPPISFCAPFPLVLSGVGIHTSYLFIYYAFPFFSFFFLFSHNCDYCISISLFIHLSSCLSVYPFVRLTDRPFVRSSVRPSVIHPNGAYYRHFTYLSNRLSATLNWLTFYILDSLVHYVVQMIINMQREKIKKVRLSK